MKFQIHPCWVPGVQLVPLGFDLLLTRVSTVDWLPGNVFHHSNLRGLIVLLWLNILKPEYPNKMQRVVMILSWFLLCPERFSYVIYFHHEYL